MPGTVTSVRWAGDWLTQLHDLADEPIDRAADLVLTAMRRTIPTSVEGSYGRPAGYARSRLRVLNTGRDSQGPYRDVGTDATTPGGDSYPAMLEHGTKPHVIESRGPWPLRDRHGRVFGRRVMHPGTRPIPWARTAAATLNGRQL